MKIADLFVDLHLDTGAFERELRGTLAKASSQSVKVKLDVDTRLADAKIAKLGSKSPTVHINVDTDRVQLTQAAKQIDSLSGRLRILANVAAAVGPALIPLGAAAIPALTGLTSQFIAVGAAGGVAMLAFQGVGDAVQALIKADVAPTEANLKKMNETMAAVGSEGERFVRTLVSMKPAFDQLRATAQANLFPGLEDALSQISTLGPEANRIVAGLANALGTLASEAGSSLSSGGMKKFLDYIGNVGVGYLLDFGHTVGNVAEGLGNLVMAFDPLSQSFSSGLLDMSRSFKKWTASLSGTEGFQEFLDYVKKSGPQALAALGAVADAFVAIITAAAPVGSVVLPVLTALVKVFTAIAGSPLGAPIIAAAAAFSTLSLAVSAAGAAMAFIPARAAAMSAGLTKMGFSAEAASVAMKGLGVAAVALGGLLIAAEGIKAIQRATDDAVPGIDSLAAGLQGVSSGSAQDAVKDLDDLGGSIDRLYDKSRSESIGDTLQKPFEGLVGPAGSVRRAEADVTALDSALAQIAVQQGPQAATAALAQLAAGAGLSDAQLSELKDHLPQLDAATDAAAAGQVSLSAAHDSAASSAAKQAQAERDLATAIDDAKNAAVNAFDAMTAYGQAIDDAQAQAAKGVDGLNKGTEAGRANRAALSGVAQAWNDLDKSAQGVPGAYKSARQTFLDLAADMNVPVDRAKHLADTLLETGKTRVKPKVELDTKSIDAKRKNILTELGILDAKTVKPKLDANDRPANTKINSTQTLINDLVGADYQAEVDADISGVTSGVDTANSLLDQIAGRAVTTYVDTVYRSQGGGGTTTGAPANKFEQDRATGGYIRGAGTGTSDSIPARLSNGEYVVRSAAVSKYGVGMLSRINSMRFAGGGPVKMAGGGDVAKAAKGVKQRAQNRHDYLFDMRIQDLLDMADEGLLGKFDKAISLLKKAQSKVKKWGDEWLQLQQQIDDIQNQRKDAKEHLKENKANYQFDVVMSSLSDAADGGDLSAYDQQIALLTAKLGKTKKWSDEYVALRQQIDELAKAKLAAQQALIDAANEHDAELAKNMADFQFDTLFDSLDPAGQIALLQDKLKGLEAWSDEYVSVLREIQQIQKQIADEAARVAEAIAEAKASLSQALTGDFFHQGVASKIVAGADFRGIIGDLVQQARELLKLGGISQDAFNSMEQAAEGYALQLEEVQAQLDANAVAQEAANKALDEAKSKLDAAKQAYDSLKDSIKGSVTALGTFAVSGAADSAKQAADTYSATLAKYGPNSVNTQEAKRRADATAISASNIVGNLSAKLAQVRQFASNIQSLRDLGLGAAAIRQILALGPIEGAPYAAALLTALPSEITELNSLQTEFDTLGEQFGSTMADAFEGQAVANAQAGVDAAQGLLDGLKSQEQELLDYMKHLAEMMIAAFKQTLGIASPSRVFQDIGVNTLLGMQKGLVSQVPNTLGSLNALADRLTVKAADITPTPVTASTVSPTPVHGGTQVSIGTVQVQDNATAAVLVQRLDFWTRQSGRTR